MRRAFVVLIAILCLLAYTVADGASYQSPREVLRFESFVEPEATADVIRPPTAAEALVEAAHIDWEPLNYAGHDQNHRRVRREIAHDYETTLRGFADRTIWLAPLGIASPRTTPTVGDSRPGRSLHRS